MDNAEKSGLTQPAANPPAIVSSEGHSPPVELLCLPGPTIEDEARIRSDERGRLARELHDSTSQLLVVLELQLMRLKQLSCAPKSPVFDGVLGELRATVAELHEEVRSVGRDGRDPRVLSDKLAAMTTEFGTRTGVVVETQIDDLPESMAPEAAHALFRVAQEALANVSRHASASKVHLSLKSDPDFITVEIVDDGIGFPLAFGKGGHGIANMRTRLDEVGGELKLENLKCGASVAATIGLRARLAG